ncbi:MAG: hypothetical protein UE367_04085 [Haemophilus parainfluenzae]|nr:hypothetical protein [Haemophilus parainfluenzae]
MVGNHDGYSDDPEYGFAEETDEDGLETGRFVTSQENFDWWENIVSNMDDLERRIENLRMEFGGSRVDWIVMESGSGYVDLENYTDVIHQALDEDLAKAQEDNNKPRKGL